MRIVVVVASQVAVIGKGGSATSRPAKVGDLVFGDGLVGTGSFAEYVSVLAEQVCWDVH